MTPTLALDTGTGSVRSPLPAPRSPLLKVLRYELSNVARSRWLLGYAAFFLLATDALLRFGGGGPKALLSLVNVVLFVIPLVGLVFGTTYLHAAREFTEVLLAQPVSRGQLFAALWLGLALPFAWHGLGDDPAALATLLTLGGVGVALTAVFVALAFLIAVRSDDRVKGLGVAVGLWLALGLLYDGLVLLLVAMFADYPIERPVLALMLANPIDLGRVLLLTRFDSGALLGYTGAVFARFFQGAGGTAVAATALALWIAVPVALGRRAFLRKDF